MHWPVQLRILLLIAGQLILLPVVIEASEKYNEQVTFRPLPDNHLLASFEFQSQSDPESNDMIFKSQEQSANPDSYAHYSIFPRTLGQIIDQTHIRELHLRFSQGWWDSESWGSLPQNGTYAGGIGVEMWAWIEGSNVNEAESRWKKLANSLSGLFCASLNFLDSSQTTYPRSSFQPFGNNVGINGSTNVHLLRGALPGEPVCTENLTPFLKLLPCKGKAGISSLLDGHRIFDSQWQAMSIDVFQVCDETTGMCKYELLQNINLVVDVPALVSRKGSGVAKPLPAEDLQCDETKWYNNDWTCFPANDRFNVNWKISEIFGRNIQGSCPSTINTDHVIFDAPDSWTWSLTDDKGQDVLLTSQQLQLQKKSIIDIQLATEDSRIIQPVEHPQIFIERSFTGYGQQEGGLRSVFTNPSLTDTVEIIYFETIPWFMRVYLQTLQVDVNTGENFNKSTSLIKADIVKDVYFRPAIDRKQPMQIELHLKIPPVTSAALSYDFDKSLLFIEEYPPDANHGFSIAPGVLTGLDKSKPFSMRTTSLLLSLPTPDFSMPYNVIILTSTLMALSFGNIFNLVIKKVVSEEVAEQVARNSLLGKLVVKLKAALKGMVDKQEPIRGPFPYEEKREIVNANN